MDQKEQLKAMLQNVINDKTEQAEVDLRDYIVSKTQEIVNRPQENVGNNE